MGFFEIFAYVLAFFYAIVPNLGIAIILLTVTVMLLMFPLTAKQAKAMVEMQRLQPEMKQLQAKHRGDRQKLNEEMMKLYQEHKVNPLGGCLPLVIQMPVFIALFQVLRNAYKYVPEGSQLYNAFCGTDSRDACKAMGPDHLEFLGMDLAESAQDVGGGFLNALPYFLLVGLVVLTGYFQSRQSQRNNPQAVGPAATITKILPIMFGVFSIGFPSGLVLYFLTSNLWRLGQQELIMRKIAPRPGVGGAAIPAKSTPAPPDPNDGADGTGTGNGKDGDRGTKSGGLLSRLMPAPAPTLPTEEASEPEPEAAPPPAPASRAAGRPRARRKKRKRR
ncbi:MAG: YidC/Oxa1 family membrane protein insertase [Candidatus Rokuibacteriota bacterium]